MRKKSAEKRIAITLEFYLRGKRRTPSVSISAVDVDYGIPLTSHAPSQKENDAFTAFNKAAHEFCQQMKDAGELK